MLDRTGLPARRLELEVTESLLITKNKFRMLVESEMIERSTGTELDYRPARAPTIEWNIFIPSVPPSSGSAARSG